MRQTDESSWQKFRAELDGLFEEAKLVREEPQHLVDKLFAIGTRQWSEMEASFSDAIRKGVENLDIASKKELYWLKSRLEKVEK